MPKLIREIEQRQLMLQRVLPDNLRLKELVKMNTLLDAKPHAAVLIHADFVGEGSTTSGSEELILL